MNIFNVNLDQVEESRLSNRVANSKLVECVLAISEAQKKLYVNRKALTDRQLEVAKLQKTNKEIKMNLMKALIERDELVTKKLAIKSSNERLSNQNDNLHREIDDLLLGDEVDSICERFSLGDQKKLSREIRDARAKLIGYGFPLSFFA